MAEESSFEDALENAMTQFPELEDELTRFRELSQRQMEIADEIDGLKAEQDEITAEISELADNIREYIDDL